MTTAPPITVENVADWTSTLTGHGGAVEVRTVLAKGGAQSRVFSPGPPGNWERIAAYAMTQDRRREVKGVYLTLNPLRAGLAENRAARDADVTRRHWLLIDIDPKRPADTNATDEEKAAAYQLALRIRDALVASGFPPPILADSGNGWHLLFAVDLPNVPESLDLVKSLLVALDGAFSTDQAGVDTTVANASRITKFYGTTPRKGAATAERPHRPSRIVEFPNVIAPVSEETIRRVLDVLRPAPETQPEPEPARRTVTATDGRPDAETRAVAYLAKCDSAISGQHGHNKAFSVACRVGPGFDLPPETALRLIRDHYNPHCQPPWSEKELAHKVADAYRVETRRGWLLDQDRPDFRSNGTGSNGTANRHAGTDGYSHGPHVETAAPEPDIDDIEIIDRWPELDRHGLHGIAGEVVALVDPHTESDPAATLAQLLLVVANLTGRGPHFTVGATRHYLNLFLVLVGLSAVGRKGTSWDIVLFLARLLDENWARTRIQGGLVSGEGLIYHVRDPVRKIVEIKEKGKPSRWEEVVTDAGMTDKRLCLIESEFSRPLKAMNRENNTLSDVLRQAWDSGNLRTLSKNSANAATEAHISIVAHATQADIRKHLSETDSANGFANRFIWTCVRKSKSLPDGGNFYGVDWAPTIGRLREAVTFARGCGEMKRDPMAAQLWREIYDQLSEGKAGLLGAILSRAEPQVMRLACVYALLDKSALVRVEHLTAALALWKYGEDSARLIFGESCGDPAAEKLLKALKAAPDGLTRKQISVDVFGRNKKSAEIVALLERLLTANLIHRGYGKSTGGRPPEVWKFGRRVKDGGTN